MDYLVTVTAHFDAHISADSEKEAIEKAERAVYGFCDKDLTDGIEFDYCEYNRRFDHIFER